MSHDTLLDLSRWQWALTAAMPITFPAVTVGTSVFLVVCYAMYRRTDDEVWLRMCRFWRRIFGIGFALGVVSGIVLTFEFGLNWGRFAHDVGVLLALTLWGGVPLVTGVALPALYIVLILMLFSLIARGVALELVEQHDGWHRVWGKLFGIGSLVAGFCQGAAFGGLVAGFNVHGDTFAGGPFTFLHHGYAVLTGLTAVALYVVAGSAFVYLTWTGTVLLDGVPPTGLERSAITWLGQRPYLLPGSLADNIAFARPEAHELEVLRAALAAGLGEVLTRLPDGLETPVGESGWGLSGGEAHRVALARTFLKRAPLPLFDEPTAHLDAGSEAGIVEVIRRLARSSTTLVASHSPAHLAACDRGDHARPRPAGRPSPPSGSG